MTLLTTACNLFIHTWRPWARTINIHFVHGILTVEKRKHGFSKISENKPSMKRKELQQSYFITLYIFVSVCLVCHLFILLTYLILCKVVVWQPILKPHLIWLIVQERIWEFITNITSNRSMGRVIIGICDCESHKCQWSLYRLLPAWVPTGASVVLELSSSSSSQSSSQSSDSCCWTTPAAWWLVAAPEFQAAGCGWLVTKLAFHTAGCGCWWYADICWTPDVGCHVCVGGGGGGIDGSLNEVIYVKCKQIICMISCAFGLRYSRQITTIMAVTAHITATHGSFILYFPDGACM